LNSVVDCSCTLGFGDQPFVPEQVHQLAEVSTGLFLFGVVLVHHGHNLLSLVFAGAVVEIDVDVRQELQQLVELILQLRNSHAVRRLQRLDLQRVRLDRVFEAEVLGDSGQASLLNSFSRD